MSIIFYRLFFSTLLISDIFISEVWAVSITKILNINKHAMIGKNYEKFITFTEIKWAPVFSRSLLILLYVF